MFLYDLFLVVIGIVLGIIVKDPLKNIITGKYKEDARQKKRVKLLLYIRENKGKNNPTTEELAEKVFLGKLDTSTVQQLLKEIEEIGLIRRMTTKEKVDGKTKWIYQKKN
ncbi:hypothetical protein QA612_06325 [Evansella sp. AB-P1]|uniref:hypothetical protein n=1 Tax=Evansella sp. AB-P1 TaxID=3037653 RepID=UPI00241CC36B|nr:hypothetical protein [Evansella sp. AB-P1]MDG5787103.1 hypothetical protein [Evansella sp. AB-P1]